MVWLAGAIGIGWGVEGTYLLAFRPGGTACAGFVGGFGVGVGHLEDVFWVFWELV